MAKFTFIDLFAGIGGFRLAAESVGGKSLGFSEIARDAIQAYCQNFHESPDNNLGDITKLRTLPKHDFMTAGVPCQSWSIAGKKLGFDDDRGQLWNDTPYLLNESRPKAFLFENVKGLADPRNAKALAYIQDRIRQAGYHANAYLLNAYDYGVPQTRVRIYIVGFKEARFFHRFFVPKPCPGRVLLGDVLDGAHVRKNRKGGANTARWSLSCNDQGFNDYFLFNDLRNGDTTVHSWDIQETTEKEKQICILLLKNRRKSQYGVLDGNALSLEHFQSLDAEIGLEYTYSISLDADAVDPYAENSIASTTGTIQIIQWDLLGTGSLTCTLLEETASCNVYKASHAAWYRAEEPIEANMDILFIVNDDNSVTVADQPIFTHANYGTVYVNNAAGGGIYDAQTNTIQVAFYYYCSAGYFGTFAETLTLPAAQ